MHKAAYGFYVVANLAPRGLMFALLLVLTRLMSTAEYGHFVLVVATGELLDMALGNWVRVYALRSEGANGLVRPLRFGRVLRLTVAMALASFVLASCSGLFQHERALAFTVSVMAYVLAFAPLRFALILLQIRRMHSVYAAVELTRAVGTLFACTAATYLVAPSSLAVSLAMAAATLTSAVLGLVKALDRVPIPKRPRAGYGAALAFGLPIIASGVLNYAIGLTDRFVVDFYLGAQAVAILGAAFSLGRQPIDLFLGPLNTYSFPHLVGLYERDGVDEVGRAQSGLLATSLMMGGAIAVLLALLADPLLTVTLPIEYRQEGARLVPLIAAGTLFLTAKAFIFDNVFHLSKRTYLQPLAMIVPAILGLLLCVVLIPRLGVFGAGISYLCATAAACVSSAVVGARIVPMIIPWASISRIGAAMIVAGAALLASRSLLASHGAWLQLIVSGLAFIAVYAATLTLLGISIRRSAETPWATPSPLRDVPLPVSTGA